MFKFLLVLSLFGVVANAGILPMSRGGTGAALVPSAGSLVTSAAGSLQMSSSMTIPSGGTLTLASGGTLSNQAPLYIPSGSTMTSPQKGAIESNGTRLYWTNSAGARFFFNFTAQ